MEYAYGEAMSKRHRKLVQKEGNKLILFQKGPISRITLNDPERNNPMGIRMITEIGMAMDEVLADEACRVILVDAKGPNFSSGHDLTEKDTKAWQNKTDTHLCTDDFGTCVWLLDNWYYKVWDYPKPIVAAVQGHVVAGALDFAQMCDIVVAATDAKFGYASFIRMSTGSPQGHLENWVLGWKKWAELILCGMRMGAADALRYGLVNKVVPTKKLIDAAMVYCENILRMPRTGVQQNKKVIRHLWNTMMGVRNGMMWGTYMDIYGHNLREDREGYIGYMMKFPSPQDALTHAIKDTEAAWKEADKRQEEEFAKDLKELNIE